MWKKMTTLAVVLLLAVGCASDPSAGEDTEEKPTTKEKVTEMLEKMFSGPDEALTKLFDQSDHEGLVNYYEEQFGGYMTDERMEDAMNTNLFTSFHQKAYSNDVKMDIKKLDVEESGDVEGAYDFDIQINISNGETAGIKGRVNTDEEGNVTRVHFSDGQPLLHAFDKPEEIEEGLYRYDSSMAEAVAGDEAYQPMYPTIMPYEVDGVQVDSESKQQEENLTFTFYGEKGEKLELTTVKDGEIAYEETETEEAMVGDQTARYAGKEGGEQRLIWTNGSITYEWKGKVEGMSKEDMIKMAESFE